MDEKKYLSIPQAAKKLGISRIALYKQVKKGTIKAIRIGRNYFIQENKIMRSSRALGLNEKKQIERAVKRTIREYGDVLRRLADE